MPQIEMPYTPLPIRTGSQIRPLIGGVGHMASSRGKPLSMLLGTILQGMGREGPDPTSQAIQQLHLEAMQRQAANAKLQDQLDDPPAVQQYNRSYLRVHHMIQAGMTPQQILDWHKGQNQLMPSGDGHLVEPTAIGNLHPALVEQAQTMQQSRELERSKLSDMQKAQLDKAKGQAADDYSRAVAWVNKQRQDGNSTNEVVQIARGAGVKLPTSWGTVEDPRTIEYDDLPSSTTKGDKSQLQMAAEQDQQTEAQKQQAAAATHKQTYAQLKDVISENRKQMGDLITSNTKLDMTPDEEEALKNGNLSDINIQSLAKRAKLDPEDQQELNRLRAIGKNASRLMLRTDLKPEDIQTLNMLAAGSPKLDDNGKQQVVGSIMGKPAAQPQEAATTPEPSPTPAAQPKAAQAPSPEQTAAPATTIPSPRWNKALRAVGMSHDPVAASMTPEEIAANDKRQVFTAPVNNERMPAGWGTPSAGPGLQPAFGTDGSGFEDHVVNGGDLLEAGHPLSQDPNVPKLLDEKTGMLVKKSFGDNHVAGFDYLRRRGYVLPNGNPIPDPNATQPAPTSEEE